MPTELFRELSEEKQTLIKNAYLRLLQTKPLDKITFNSLSKEAGIARTSLYVYFKDRKDLCDFVFSDFTALVKSGLVEIYQKTQNLFLYAKELFSLFQSIVIKLDYGHIVKNIAAGIKMTPIHGFEFFDEMIYSMQENFTKGDNADIVEIVLILLRHNISMLFFTMSYCPPDGVHKAYSGPIKELGEYKICFEANRQSDLWKPRSVWLYVTIV